jgi:hypothetical protein
MRGHRESMAREPRLVALRPRTGSPANGETKGLVPAGRPAGGGDLGTA